MKQNIAILALFVGAVAAQTRGDKDVRGPTYKADKSVTQCELSGDETVSKAAADKKVSSDEVEKLKGKLVDAIKLVKDERTKRDEAVLAVIEKDKLFKAELDAADAAENTAMALYKTANDAQKAYDDAKAKAAMTQIATTAMKADWDAAKADKEAAEKAVSDAVDHKTAEDDDVTAKKSAYGGVIDGSNSDTAGDCTGGACKVAKDAKTAYDSAQAALKSDKDSYDAKVIAVADALVVYNGVKAVSDIGLEVKTTQAGIIGADVNAGVQKTKKAADDALAAYGTTGSPDGDLYTKQQAFNVAADAMGEAWKVVVDHNVAKDYAGTDARDCTEQGTASNFAELTDVNRNKAECITECQKKDYFDFAGTKAMKDHADYCYGIEISSADKCRMYKAMIPSVAGDQAQGGKGCYTRTASVKAKAAFVTDNLDNAFDLTVTAYSSTITAAWEALIDTAETERRDLDLETKIQTYITATYLEKDPTGLTFITAAKKKIYDDLVVEETNLKNTADGKGMNEDTTLASYSNKSMKTLKKEYDDAVALQVIAETNWKASVTEQTRMVATDKINAAWKLAATGVFNAVDAKYTGADKQAKVQEADDKDRDDKETLYTAEQKKYTDHIALADYTTPAAKAKTDESGSDITAQKDVVTARGLASDANTKVKEAIVAEAKARTDLADEVVKCAGLETKLEEALEKCESAQYANFRKTFQDATTKRGTNLTTIKELMEKREKAAAATKPGSGKAGARCERPRSNGDARGRKACEAELCCGAATKVIGQTEVSIETCQKADATKYSYQPPRAAMGLAMPAVESWDFACIGGAKRVLAAAAAAAAAGLMMQ